MPVITDITPQKRQGYYNIFIDGVYSLSLPESELAAFQLRPNQMIDEQLVIDLHQAHLGSLCYSCSLRYLAVRPRSISEVRKYLIFRRKFEPEDVERTIENLIGQKYLDDIDFARLWIKNRLDLAPRSMSIIRIELVKKGVDKDVIDFCLSEINSDQELASICELTSRRIRQPKYQDKQKLTEFLSRRGYNYSLIKRAFTKLALFEN